MKAITALTLLKRHGLAHSSLTLRDLKRARTMFGYPTWEELIRVSMFGEYLYGKTDRVIRVPEARFEVGGTVRYRVVLDRRDE